ncbi:MAG: hypothetical protein Q9207_001745 [Kuettlingeria erythrocarpa]
MAFPSSAGSTPAIKRSHSEVGSDDPDLALIPLSSRRFASRIVDVYVGDDRFHYSVHEAFLFLSKELKRQFDAQKKAKKGSKKNENVLNLPRETTNEFGQLLEFLYIGKLTLHATEPAAQAEELLGLWMMGTKHELVDMQKHVIRKLEERDIAGKLPTLQFLSFADKLYEAESDHGLRDYFRSVATDVVRKVTPADMAVLSHIFTEGGSFASDLFLSYNKVFGPNARGSALEQAKTIKVEGSEQQRAAKRAKIDDGDVRTAWDKANNIPEALETASLEDKLLVTWVEDHKAWVDIAEAWENATGDRVSIADLEHRYKRIDANVLRLGKRDSELLLAAKAAVEAKLNNDKWPLIAARIAENGGTIFNPVRLQRYCDALDIVKSKAEDIEEKARTDALQVQSLRPGQQGAGRFTNANEDQIQTEIVGGVRVENSKPLGVKRKRRGAVKAPTATAAKKPANTTTTITKFTVDVSDNSDEETVLASPVARNGDANGLFVGEDEDEGPVDTGVRVSNEKTGVQNKTLGNMRQDRFASDGPSRGVNVVNGGQAQVTNGEEVIPAAEEVFDEDDVEATLDAEEVENVEEDGIAGDL